MLREDCMTEKQKSGINSLSKKMFGGKRVPRTHQNMVAATGVARPGKTAKDKSKRL